MGLYLGIIADDFSGASDAASFFANNNIKTVLCNGVPDSNDRKLNEIIDEGAVIVIALKIRSANKDKAILEVDNAFKYFREKEAEKIFYKYCSTFDSTPDGNIGPVVDFLLNKTKQQYTILEPGLPINGRTVKNGILYLDGVELDKTHMRNHPLNPMWSSSIAELMKPQGEYDTIIITKEDMLEGLEYIEKNIFDKLESKFYVVPDYYDDECADLIVDNFNELYFLTGGSGLNDKLSKKIIKQYNPLTYKHEIKNIGKSIIISGSCSEMTLRQIEHYPYKKVQIDMEEAMNNLSHCLNKLNIIVEENNNVLFYSSNTSEEVKKTQSKYSMEEVATNLEIIYSNLAKNALKNNFNNFIVAGGETSGAVTKTLNYNNYIIGDSIEPGVPVLIPMDNENIRLVLKSGNFGKEDFFLKTLKMIGNNDEQ